MVEHGAAVASVLVAVERADAVPLAVGAGISLVAWFLLAGAVLAATRPRLPDAGPATTELGPEPPAVANLLAHRCHVTATAVSGTLLDLAARRVLDVDQVAPDTFLCRLSAHRSDKGELNRYEAKVLDLVRDKATREGTVATRELSLGHSQAADRWWKAFSKLVVDDARKRGLVRRRFGRLPAVVISATLLVPFLLGGAAMEVLATVARAAGSTAESDEVGGGMLTALVVWALVIGLAAAKLRLWRETDAGRTATAHWLGFRDNVRETELLMSSPPAGVTIWGRNLSYGVALGSCPAAAQALPIGPQRDDEAWSAYGGLWREVDIEYPSRFYEGEPPTRTALLGVAWLALTTVLGFFLLRTMGPMLVSLLDTVITEDGPAWLRLMALTGTFFGVGVPFLWCGYKMAVAFVTLWRALPDLGATPVTFEGQVLRVPWHWARSGDSRRWEPTGFTAVDPGTGDVVRALRYHDPLVGEGSIVRVTMTPRLRHVTSCEVLDEATAARRWSGPRPATEGEATTPPAAPGPAAGAGPGLGLPGVPAPPASPGVLAGALGLAGAATTPPPPPVPAASPATPAPPPVPAPTAGPAGRAGLGEDDVRRLTGLELVPLPPTTGAEAVRNVAALAQLLRGETHTWAFGDGATGRLVAVAADGGHLGALARRALGVMGEAVPGVGDQARWVRGTTLVATRGDQVALVQVELPLDPPARQAAARALAGHLLA